MVRNQRDSSPRAQTHILKGRWWRNTCGATGMDASSNSEHSKAIQVVRVGGTLGAQTEWLYLGVVVDGNDGCSKAYRDNSRLTRPGPSCYHTGASLPLMVVLLTTSALRPSTRSRFGTSGNRC